MGCIPDSTLHYPVVSVRPVPRQDSGSVASNGQTAAAFRYSADESEAEEERIPLQTVAAGYTLHINTI